jgi:hypothetical protein
MKTKTLFTVAVALLVVLAVVGGYASEKQPVAVDEAMKMFEGTYENNEYSSWTYPRRFAIEAGGIIMEWVSATQKKPSWIGDFKVVECWKDSEGNLYCTLDTQYRGGDFLQELWRLDNSGGTFERTFTRTFGNKYPENIEPNPDPDASPKLCYMIYYRQ